MKINIVTQISILIKNIIYYYSDAFIKIIILIILGKKKNLFM